MRSLTITLLLLAACGGDKEEETTDVAIVDSDTDTDTDTDTDADADTDTDTDTDVDCDVAIAALDPEPNFQLAPVDQVVSLSFDGAITPSDNWSLGLTGVAGVSALDSDGMGATFTPDVPLDHDTLYTVEAEVCADVASTNFRTLPTPVDALSIEGRSYNVPFDGLNITEPPNSALLEQFLPIDILAVQVGTLDPVTNLLDAYGAVANLDAGVPVLDCGAAISDVELDFSLNPFFQMGPTTLFVDAGADQIAIRDFQLLGRFNADGTEIQNVSVSGLVDLSTQTGATSCGTVSSLTGGTCVPCTIGAVTSDCLVFQADAPSGTEDPALDIEGICFGATM